MRGAFKRLFFALILAGFFAGGLLAFARGLDAQEEASYLEGEKVALSNVLQALNDSEYGLVGEVAQLQGSVAQKEKDIAGLLSQKDAILKQGKEVEGETIKSEAKVQLLVEREKQLRAEIAARLLEEQRERERQRASYSAPPPQQPQAPPPVSRSGGNVTLTFDDGPYSAASAYAILDILAVKGVRGAIFFVNCQAKGMPDVTRRILNEGHILANHTCRHPDLTTLGYDGIKGEILSNEIPGMAKILRPPYGARNSIMNSVAAELGYSVMLWSIDTQDWTGISSAAIVSTVANNLHSGAIVLMHLNKANTIEALPTAIDTILNAGYSIGY